MPQLYSYFGSQGILLVTILQSYPQGAGVWGTGYGCLDECRELENLCWGNVPGKLLTSLVDSIGSYYYTTPDLRPLRAAHVVQPRNTKQNLRRR
ncbi:hypothetical protein [Arthrobacter polaris]|uniref:hypothetical protein n=1 Tax=Arthrobacter polaris TaxID=2813727 RepID=UPI0038991F0B|nr:hypothetical protein J0916_03980 [Arthrobacter polaris]